MKLSKCSNHLDHSVPWYYLKIWIHWIILPLKIIWQLISTGPFCPLKLSNSSNTLDHSVPWDYLSVQILWTVLSLEIIYNQIPWTILSFNFLSISSNPLDHSGPLTLPIGTKSYGPFCPLRNIYNSNPLDQTVPWDHLKIQVPWVILSFEFIYQFDSLGPSCALKLSETPIFGPFILSFQFIQVQTPGPFCPLVFPISLNSLDHSVP